jgi:hypothetical protein
MYVADGRVLPASPLDEKGQLLPLELAWELADEPRGECLG